MERVLTGCSAIRPVAPESGENGASGPSNHLFSELRSFYFRSRHSMRTLPFSCPIVMNLSWSNGFVNV